MKEEISIQSGVAMSLQRLGTGNTLCSVGELYGWLNIQLNKL